MPVPKSPLVNNESKQLYSTCNSNIQFYCITASKLWSILISNLHIKKFALAHHAVILHMVRSLLFLCSTPSDILGRLLTVGKSPYP